MNHTTPLVALSYRPDKTLRCHYCQENADYQIEQDGTPDPRYGTAKYLCWRCRLYRESLWIASAPYEDILANVYLLDTDILSSANIDMYKRRLAGETFYNWKNT